MRRVLVIIGIVFAACVTLNLIAYLMLAFASAHH